MRTDLSVVAFRDRVDVVVHLVAAGEGEAEAVPQNRGLAVVEHKPELGLVVLVAHVRRHRDPGVEATVEEARGEDGAHETTCVLIARRLPLHDGWHGRHVPHVRYRAQGGAAALCHRAEGLLRRHRRDRCPGHVLHVEDAAGHPAAVEARQARDDA